MKESEVEERVRTYLREKGFNVIERTSLRGVDIQATKDGRNHYIEVEGNTKPNGDPLPSSEKYTHILRAIGQICLRMADDPAASLYLALPKDRYYRDKIDALSIALGKLGVSVLWF